MSIKVHIMVYLKKKKSQKEIKKNWKSMGGSNSSPSNAALHIDTNSLFSGNRWHTE